MKVVKLTAEIEHDGDAYVATCPELDIIRHGKTPLEAKENLKDAMRLYLDKAYPEEDNTSENGHSP